MNTSVNFTSRFEPPRYQHACEWCVYLGRWLEADLYAHETDADSTVIARYSSTPEDYSSGLPFAQSGAVAALTVALMRAKAHFGMFKEVDFV